MSREELEESRVQSTGRFNVGTVCTDATSSAGCLMHIGPRQLHSTRDSLTYFAYLISIRVLAYR